MFIVSFKSYFNYLSYTVLGYAVNIRMSQSKYFDFLKQLPRVGLDNVKPNPYSFKRGKQHIGKNLKNSYYNKYSNMKKHIGFSYSTPFQKKIPQYGYNRETHLKRQFLPFTLWDLQRLIDLGRIDPSDPIDVTTIANARFLNLDKTEFNCYGLYLLEQGANIFEAKVNIEVQIADELSIASVEKCGGTITTAFYDRPSFLALCNPVEYFLKGQPIHKRMLPPQDLVPYYTDPKTRGYLTDPVQIREERQNLAEKYGYVLPDITEDEQFEMLTMKKDPRQIFFGLSPGWIVNLADETVIKPEEKYLVDHSVV
ncbi:large ribosomal subunit protein uL15m-like [Clavelina lepadiformis]|uniref:large ribosomal subunit protein uL15m-like n=1 Tax=Clavelina lepadiformis TaxID=159417 RepID=UPI00404242F9